MRTADGRLRPLSPRPLAERDAFDWFGVRVEAREPSSERLRAMWTCRELHFFRLAFGQYAPGGLVLEAVPLALLRRAARQERTNEAQERRAARAYLRASAHRRLRGLEGR